MHGNDGIAPEASVGRSLLFQTMAHRIFADIRCNRCRKSAINTSFWRSGRIDQGFRLRGTNRPEGFDAVSSS
jgi:hypothetical protein